MSTPLLATKLYIPPPRPNVVLRPRLIERLNEGLHRKLTLISAPAGFGKTTLVSTWIAACGRPVAWLSLDEGGQRPDTLSDLPRRCVADDCADDWRRAVGGAPVPAATANRIDLLTTLLNEIATHPAPFRPGA